MAGLINIGAGLSQMGSAIATSAGQMALQQQKTDLEMQKEQLISQLAEGRESRLEAQREAGASKLSAQESTQRVTEYGKEKQTDIANLPLIAKANDQIMEAQANDPKWIAAKKKMVDATATPEQRAAAAYYSQQAIGQHVANIAAQDLQDARQELSDATDSGDRAAIAKAQQHVAAAQYSMHDEVQRAAALIQQESNDRMQVQAIEAQIAAHTPEAGMPATAEQTALLTNLKADLAVAQDNYATSHAMAQSAASRLPAFDTGGAGNAAGGQSGTRPPLGTFYKKPPPGSAQPPSNATTP